MEKRNVWKREEMKPYAEKILRKVVEGGKGMRLVLELGPGRYGRLRALLYV